MPKIVIIGSGPAGISAALYAVRAGVDTTVLTKGPGALDRAEKIENYYGFAEPVSGAELERRSIENAKRLGVRFVTAEAVGLTYTDKLTVETVDKNYPADAVILATGASRAVPRIPGLAGLEGHGVSYCAACDAFFYRGKDVAVLGSGEYALHEVQALLPVAKSVSPADQRRTADGGLPAGGHSLSAGRGGCSGRNRLSPACSCPAVCRLPVSGVFVALGVAGSTALARKIGAEVNGQPHRGGQKNADHRARPVCGRVTAPAAFCRWQRPCMRARRRVLKPPRPCGKDEKQCRKQQRNTAIVWPKRFPFWNAPDTPTNRTCSAAIPGRCTTQRAPGCTARWKAVWASCCCAAASCGPTCSRRTGGT